MPAIELSRGLAKAQKGNVEGFQGLALATRRDVWGLDAHVMGMREWRNSMHQLSAAARRYGTVSGCRVVSHRRFIDLRHCDQGPVGTGGFV
jgi:hypothetical protein